MNERRNLAILGGAALVAGAMLLLRRGPAAAHPPVPVHTATPPAAEATAAPPSPDEARHLDADHEAARKARDEKRAQILAALQRKSAASAPASARAPASAPPAADDAEPPHGRYDPEYIRHVFREDMFPIMKQCYETALKSHPTLGGRLALKFSIVGDSQVGGVVEDADFTEDSDLKNDEMRTCVRESLMALTFDKPPSGGGKVTVTYPVLFSPGDDEEADGGQRR